MNRRGFLAGILAAGVAPAAIGSGILMPVRGASSVIVGGRIGIQLPLGMPVGFSLMVQNQSGGLVTVDGGRRPRLWIPHGARVIEHAGTWTILDAHA
jgi:hypothetical protein